MRVDAVEAYMDVVEAYLAAIRPAPRAAEARRLTGLFAEVTGFGPRLWPGGILGFGRYAYRFASGRTGEGLATGFALRGREIALYIMPGGVDFRPILARLGPHRRGRTCIYLRSLEGVDEGALADLIRAGVGRLRALWRIDPD